MRRVPDPAFTDKRATQERRQSSNWRIGLITVVVIAVLYLAKPVVVPVALAILFAFLLSPIVSILERTFIRRTGAIVLSLGIAVAGLGLGGWWIYQQFNAVAKEFTESAALHRVEQRMRFLRRSSSGLAIFERFERTLQRVTQPAQPPEKPLNVRVVEDTNLRDRYRNLAPTIEGVASIFLVIVLVFFLLQDREQLRDKMLRLAGRAHLTVTTQAIGETSDRISRYLLTFALLNVAFGALIAVGLFALQVPHWALWGVLAGLLRFVPYVGAVLSAAMPTFLSLAVFPNWYTSLAVLGLFVLSDQLLGGFI